MIVQQVVRPFIRCLEEVFHFFPQIHLGRFVNIVLGIHRQQKQAQQQRQRGKGAQHCSKAAGIIPVEAAADRSEKKEQHNGQQSCRGRSLIDQDAGSRHGQSTDQHQTGAGSPG